ncbi:hypothetical protein MARHY1142 [Marinobacter nauticus ATCC 49840]|nr:hypothetical protein MARHY1142 [Marinobacter nauticus ATCC 49840]
MPHRSTRCKLQSGTNYNRKLFSNRFRSLSNDPVFIAITDSEHFAENLLHNAHHHALVAWMALLASAISCWLNT